MKTVKNKVEGITLIALIITIIVLLILAGVTISNIKKPDGVISEGWNAKDLAEIDMEKEALSASVIKLLGNKRNATIEDTENDRKKLQNNLESYIGSNKISVSSAIGDGYIFKVIFEDSQRVYYVDEDGDIIDTITPRYIVCYYLENIEDSEYSIVKTERFEISNDERKNIQIQSLVEKSSITGGTFSYATVNGTEVTEFVEEKEKIVNLYYTRNLYTLTLNKEDNNITSVQGNGTYKYGQSVQISATLSNIEGSNVSFKMWKSSNSNLLSNQINRNTTIKMPNGDITLTAIASNVLNKYVVTYNGNGSTSGSMATSTHVYGTAQNLTKNEFEKTGYTFKEWNTKADGSGTSFTDEQNVINLTAINNDTVNLYAQWEDTIAPTASVITVTDIQTSSVTVSVTAQDMGSGTVKVEWLYKIADAEDETYIVASTDTWTATVNSVTKTASITELTDNTSYTIKAVIYDAAGNSITRTISVKTIEEEVGTTVADLISQNAFEVGDYVEYSVGTGLGTSNGSYTIPTTLSGYTMAQTFDVTSYTGTWQILYTGSEGYGAQIVSTQSVIGNFAWGTGMYGQSGLYIKGDTGYANLVRTLNTLSGYYINSNYATSARSLGSSPSDIQTSIGNTDKYSGTDTHVPTNIYDKDENYQMDNTQLNKNKQLKQATGAVWLASRSVTDQTITNPYDYWQNLYGDTWANYYGNYGARIIYSYGTSYGAWSYAYTYPTPLVFLENTYYIQTPYSFGAGARPCITLNSNLKLLKTTNSSGNTVWKIIE